MERNGQTLTFSMAMSLRPNMNRSLYGRVICLSIFSLSFSSVLCVRNKRLVNCQINLFPGRFCGSVRLFLAGLQFRNDLFFLCKKDSGKGQYKKEGFDQEKKIVLAKGIKRGGRWGLGGW